jgi:hypothetical protein
MLLFFRELELWCQSINPIHPPFPAEIALKYGRKHRLSLTLPTRSSNVIFVLRHLVHPNLRFLYVLVLGVLSSCSSTPQPPEAIKLLPSTIRGNTKTDIIIEGKHFDSKSKVLLDKNLVAAEVISAASLSFTAPALPRGNYAIQVQTSAGQSSPLSLSVLNSTPIITDPGTQLIEAGKAVRVQIEASDPDGDLVMLQLSEMPQDSTWDDSALIFDWQTTAQDADSTHDVLITASDPEAKSEMRFSIKVVKNVPDFTFDRMMPDTHLGNQSFELLVQGTNFTTGDIVYLNDEALLSVVRNSDQIAAQLPPQARDFYDITVRRGSMHTDLRKLQILNSVPTVHDISATQILEDADFSKTVTASDFDGDDIRMYALNLPAGAQFNASTQTIKFKPDFVQGSKTHEIIIAATDGQATGTATLTLTVIDNISPPWPTITSTEVHSNHLRLALSQTTDDYLESPSEAGREYLARIIIPTSGTGMDQFPVRVFLHGFGGGPYNGGVGGQFRIYPADPDNTYWWGHSYESSAPNYTQRRVLHLIEWILRHYPEADPNRVYVTGPSMGGAGAAELGLLYARHFSHVDSTIGQMIARNHRPSRIQQLSGLWGSPQDNFDSGNGIGAWDRQDLTRALRDEHDAKNQFIYTKHGKDDPTIHFGAVTHASPQTMYSFYDALQVYRIGHFVVWDEGGHGSADPVLGSNWWNDDWNRSTDEITYLRRNLAFPAFTRSSANNDPGDGSSNGTRTWNDTRGYSGTVATPEDTGWNGDVAGTMNRYLRWDSRAIKDTWARFEIPIRAKFDDQGSAPTNNYPASGDKYFGPTPIRADVTLRRIQAFHCLPQEPITWTYGQQTGIIRADNEGTVTIPEINISREFQTLVLVRTED